MRGRKPEELTIAPEDRPRLEMIAHRRQWPWFQVQRAKVILALAAGQRSEILAAGMGCDRTTIWRIGQCYQDRGLEGLLSERTRPGHPPEISPPPTSPDRGLGLFGARRPGPAHHPLEQRGPGPPGGGRRHRRSHQ